MVASALSILKQALLRGVAHLVLEVHDLVADGFADLRAHLPRNQFEQVLALRDVVHVDFGEFEPHVLRQVLLADVAAWVHAADQSEVGVPADFAQVAALLQEQGPTFDDG